MTADPQATRGPSLTEVLPSALSVLGMPQMPDRLGLSQLLPDVQRIAVLLVDGLGYHLLPRARPVASALADVVDGRVGTLFELSCEFPSTTPTSLVSLGTGARSGAHGILGFTLNVPGTDRVLDHIRWRDDPDPRVWQPLPTLFSQAAASGVSAVAVLRAEYEGSGLTDAAYRGAPHLAAPGPDALADQMLASLRVGQRLVYGYHPTLDSVAHEFGIDSPQWLVAASEVDRLISKLIGGLPTDAGLLVTADHGGLDVPADGRIDIDTDSRLAAAVRVVAGEPRMRHLHTRPGAQRDVLETWRAVLGPAADVLSREQAVAADWFGPVPEVHQARIGDVVVACRDRSVVLASKHEPKAVGKLVAYHGSMTREETAIPLIVHSGR